MRTHAAFWGLAGLLALPACADDIVAPSAPPPKILSAIAAANPRNVLSAVVIVRLESAHSAEVRYRGGAEPDGVAPAVRTSGDSVVVPVLGLAAETAYDFVAVAHGAGQAVMSEPISFVTGALPEDLPAYAAVGADPSPGFVAFSAGPYGLVVDNGGRVVWYHRFEGGAGLNFQAQPTGRYAAVPPPTGDGEPPRWIEIDPLGNVTRTFGCAPGFTVRFHDLLADPDGSYWLLCDETRTMDLSALGGVADARVTGTGVQHVSGDGALLFRWSPFDHFDIADLDPAARAGPMVNWTHGNALDRDAAGNLLLSFRSLGEITSIDSRTGDVLWRMGGTRNEFEFGFDGVSTPAFAWQHGLRTTGEGSLILLDNRGDPAESRAERYEFDAGARTARRVASYGSLPPVVALLGGTTQPLPGGRALVSFGNGGRVEEYDASGNVVWSIDQPGYVFRAQRIASLYRPGVGTPR